MTSIAIIGAGIAGLTLARQLSDHVDVTVFEKSRGMGGRMATRSASPYAFDHGAQFFTAKSDAFQAAVAEWLRLGIVRPWNIRFAEFEGDSIVARRRWDDDYPHYVGVPGMKNIGKHLARDLNVSTNTEIMPVERVPEGWLVREQSGRELGRFDWVISAAPAAQTAALLPEIRLHECYALMLGFPAASEPRIDWEAALVREADISWISVNSSKPQRDPAFSMVIHSTNAYAEAQLNSDNESVQAHLLQEVRRVTGLNTDTADHCVLHRWRYANIAKQAGDAYLLDPDRKLGVCSDWLIRGRIEAAFASASLLAAQLRELLHT